MERDSPTFSHWKFNKFLQIISYKGTLTQELKKIVEQYGYNPKIAQSILSERCWALG